MSMKGNKALFKALVYTNGHKGDGFIPGIWDGNAVNTKELGMHRYPEVHLFFPSQLFSEIMIHQSSWCIMKL